MHVYSEPLTVYVFKKRIMSVAHEMIKSLDLLLWCVDVHISYNVIVSPNTI